MPAPAPDLSALSRGRVLDAFTSRSSRERIGAMLGPLLARGDMPYLHHLILEPMGARPHRLVFISDLHAR